MPSAEMSATSAGESLTDGVPRSAVALVTGGGRGIGAEIVRSLATSGYAVVVNYVTDRAAADDVVKRVRAAGGQALACPADVSDPDQVARLVETTRSHFGEPEVLINNAGRGRTASVRRQTPGDWDRTIAVNLSAAYYCTQAVLDTMVAGGWGRIVFLSSPVGSRTPMPGQSAYAAAKAGLVAMSKSIALEVAGTGVTVNAVMPGYVETDMTREVGEQGVAFMRRTWPQIPSSAIADCVSFLVSDQAEQVSGEEIGVWLGGPVHTP